MRHCTRVYNILWRSNNSNIYHISFVCICFTYYIIYKVNKRIVLMNEKNKSRPPRAAVHFTIQIKTLAYKHKIYIFTYSQSIYWAWLALPTSWEAYILIYSDILNNNIHSNSYISSALRARVYSYYCIVEI